MIYLHNFKTWAKIWYFVILLSSIIHIGCSGDDRGLAPVSGTIIFKGKPLANAGINFIPEDTTARVAVGSTDKDGKYKLSSYQINDGAKIGRYSITIRAEEGGDSNLKPADALDFVRGKIITPLKYSRPDTSGLTAEVARKNNVIDFELKE
ncbi:MAG: hypothetical protein EBT92_06865 [Planctomycetes bacterium]|nr:hypothetical protein [Planctomycetota bacterium]NBY02792.1 hypothetical protein [Planctomycetota bacterium]